MLEVNVWLVYMAPQNIPRALVLTLGNKVILYSVILYCIMCMQEPTGRRLCVSQRVSTAISTRNVGNELLVYWVGWPHHEQAYLGNWMWRLVLRRCCLHNKSIYVLPGFPCRCFATLPPLPTWTRTPPHLHTSSQNCAFVKSFDSSVQK